MKKISLFSFIMLMAATLFAQGNAEFGLKGGLNIASLKIDNVNNDAIDARTSFHIGGLAHIHLAPEWAIQPEFVYSGQGMKQDFGNNDYEYKLGYINIPVMLQYMFNNGFRLEAGPQLGILVNAKQEDVNGVDVDVKDDYKTADVGLGFGLSYLTYSGIGFGARYNLGLTDINDFGVNEIKNRVGHISIFYMFDNRHKAKSR